MREILFRAKRIDDDEWIYGFFVITTDEYIEGCETHKYEMFKGPYRRYVNPETVGQFTGLTDKNGTKIFEGDIVKQTFSRQNHDEYCDEDIDGYEIGATTLIPSHGACIKRKILYVEINGEVVDGFVNTKVYKNIAAYRSEVIGNIHENPELLEVSHDHT
jgi:uncharacterized phage protein (TIGR01671 family)